MAQSVGPIARPLDVTATGRPDPRRCRAGGRPKRDGSRRRRSGTRRRRGAPRFRGGHRSAARCARAAMDPEGGRRIRAPSMPWGRRPNSRRCSARPTASWSRMLSSRASSGRNPWVAAEVMISMPPAVLERSERARRCRHRGRERAGAGGSAARARTPPAGPDASSPVAASDSSAPRRRPEPLGEERLHLTDEGRTRQLIRQDRRDADGDGRGALARSPRARSVLDQRQVGVERRPRRASRCRAASGRGSARRAGGCAARGRSPSSALSASPRGRRPGGRPRGTDPPSVPSRSRGPSPGAPSPATCRRRRRRRSARRPASWNASGVYASKTKPVTPSSTVSARPPTRRTIGGAP